ncbi:C6 finger domain-containing protein [Purpureocillium lavendulum]|uniref:C6 finger domain-containing protein n=1 Tax=Purpureocillium lavendulum TaxID=1247861 RepID=A0AB34G0A6_9HYPO|nr:C6 finger domain-containing protein [Purpureocillium lavendulum]
MLDDASPRDLEHTSSWASFLPNTQSSLVKDASTSATGAGYVSPSSEPNDAGHDDESRHLLNEFTKTTVYLLYSTSTRDTLRTHLYNLAQQSEPLYNVLIAIHLYTSNPENPPPQFEEYYDRSLRMFRDQLARYDGTLNEGLMSAGIFICTLNLFQANPWSAHLKHMLQVYGFDASGGQLGRFADMKLRFPVEVMAVMDLPTFVRGRQTTTLGIWTRFRGAQQALHGRKESGVELVSGIPRSLLDIFATIEDESAEAAFLSWPGEVGEVPQCHLWEAYRLAGVLVGRRLRRKQHDETHSGSGSPTAETLLARLVAALDALCDTRLRPEYSHLLALNATLYPCTAARQEIATLRGRPGWVDQLRRILRLCEPYGKTANAKTVDKMLNEALEGGDDDFDIDEVAKKRGVEISLL